MAGDDSYGPYDFTASLSYAGQGLSDDSVTLNEQNLFVIAQSGGRAIGLVDGVTVTVDIPNGAITEPIDLRINPPGELSPPPTTLIGDPIRITAVGRQSGLPVTQFSNNITIQLTYDENQYQAHESALVLKYYDVASGFWRTLGTVVDEETDLLIAYSDHLTDFGVDVQTWQMAQLPSLEAYQVSPYSGAASNSIPIRTPPGPGGLQPSVSLAYNSQTVDGASARTQAGIAGMGWSLSAGGYIQRNMNGTNDDLSDDTFSIVAGGVSSSLLPVQDHGAYVEFRTADESFWRIYAHEGSTPQFTKWEAWDKQGFLFNLCESPASLP